MSRKIYNALPVLARAVANTAQSVPSNVQKAEQTASQALRQRTENRNARTQRVLEELGQVEQARGRADALTEDFRRTGGSLNPSDYNSVGDYLKNAPYSTQAVLTNAMEDALSGARDRTADKPFYRSSPIDVGLAKVAEGMGISGRRGTLTDEMKAAGLTQKDIDRWNNAQNEADRQNLLSEWAGKHKVGATINAIPENAFGSMRGTLEKLGNYVQGKPMEDKPTNADIYRQTVSDSIDNKIGKFAYGVGNSIGDMGFATLLTAPLGGIGGAGQLGKLAPKAAATIMGLEKANETMNDAISRGLTDDQILAEGVGSGVTTALTEMIPMGKFANGGHIAGAMLSEGLQEGAEDIADTILDELVTGMGGNADKATLHRAYNEYKEAGYDDRQALWETIKDYGKQVGLDTLAGAVSGGALGAAGNMMSGRNIITGKLPSLNTNENTKTNVDEDINENVDNVNGKVDTVEDKPADVKEVITRLKDKIINALDSNNPFAGEAVSDLRDRFNYLAKENPDLLPFLKEAYNEVEEHTGGWVTRFGGNENAEMEQQTETPTAQPTEQTQQNIPSVQQTENQQTVQSEESQIPTINRISPEQIAQLSNIANQYANNIENFNVKGTKKYANQIRKAYEQILNTTGDAQIKALENFNNLLDKVNEVMAGEEVGVNARDFNRDFYTQMQEATDGYKIKISPELQSELETMYGYKGVAKLSDNLFNTGSNNHIKLVSSKYDGGLNIGDAYGEIYEASGRMLPNPDGMSDMQKMKALIDYINEYKADKNDTVDTHTWEEMNTQRELSPDEQSAVGLVNGFVDNLANIHSRREIDNAFETLTKQISDINRKNPDLGDTLLYLMNYASEALRNKPESSVKLDDDIQNIQTLEEAVNKLYEEAESSPYPINLQQFAEAGEEANTPDTEEYGRVNTGRTRTSEAYTNTGLNSGIMTDEQQTRHDNDDSMQMMENAERESVEEANKRLDENGFKGEFDRLLNKKGFNNVDVDEAMILWREFSNRVKDLKARGLDYKNELQKAYDIFVKIKNESSEHGSALQALAKWSRNNTPEGLLSEAAAIIRKAKLTKDGSSIDWNQEVAKETKNKTDMMDIDFMDRFLTEASKLDGLNMDSREARHIMANLGKMVNSQIPITLREKITTILMDNMLGNARTLLTRNAGGNIGFNFIEDFAKKPLAALLDKGMEKITGKRTTLGLTPASIKAGWEGFKAGLAQEAYDFKNDIQSARSGENTLATATANNRNALTSKIGKMYNKLVKAGLSVGDRPFYEKTYAMSMAEYEKLYKMGKLKDAAGNLMPRKDFEELAKAYAQLNALVSVYQDDSDIAKAFMGMKEAVNHLSRGVAGADVLSQFTMPFVKTPANIIQRSIEYSPIGIVKNAVQTIRELNHAQTANGKLDFNQARFVNESARNIIGTALFVAGMAMAQGGTMTGGYSDDKDMAQAQKEAGMQEYALHNPFGLNADVDISWIPVLGNNAVAAASAYDAMSKPELNTAQRIGQGLTAGLKSQFESSALQGLQRLVGGSGSFGNDGGDLLSNSVDTLKSGMTQFIPSLLRQAAAASDPYQRKLSGPNPDDYYINSVLSAIPGLRQTLEPKIGRNGEALEQNHAQTLAGRIFNNFINPATVTYGTEDAVRDEAMRLFESTGNNVAFQPSVTMSELKKDDHVPTAEEFTRYQQQAYGAMNSVATQLIGSDYYNSLSDGDKEQLLADTYSAIKTVEKTDILNGDTDTFSGAAKAYYEGGEEGLIEYMTARSALSQMGMANNEKNREMVLDTLHNDGEEGVNEMVERSQELADAGLDANMQFKYDHAINYIPSLTPTQFTETWNTINTDGNTSIKQQEILDYLNQKPTAYTDAQAMEYWNAYGSDWKKIPVLDENTGLWKAK